MCQRSAYRTRLARLTARETMSEALARFADVRYTGPRQVAQAAMIVRNEGQEAQVELIG